MYRKSIVMTMLLLLVLAVQGFAYTSYTSRAAFDADVMGMSVQHIINLDWQTNGLAPNYDGKLSLYANGLDSDGLTGVGLSPVVTNAFPTSSGLNSIGPDDANRQYLAGNSDTITFYFTGPVHAFGLYLIGNPSPTGEPALPFWKMSVNTSAGINVYSATDPQYSISAGNDVYFMGVVSLNEPFTQVTVYSDNDPAAVFSFNIDDVFYGTNAKLVSIEDVKSETAGTVVMISHAPIERVHNTFFGTRFNVESENKTSGIVVIGNPNANRNNALTFTGTMTSTSDNEVAISLDEILETDYSVNPVPSLGMGTLSLGGGVTKGLQAGIPGSIGPNNIGMDVTIWGKITAVHNDPNPYAGGSWIIVDDGAGRPSGVGEAKGVKVTGVINAANRSAGDFVVIRGSSSLWKSVTSDYYPLVRVAAPEDITP